VKKITPKKTELRTEMDMEGTNEIDNRIIGSLRNLEAGTDEISRLATGYRELLQIQMEAKLSVTVVRPNLSETLVRERLGEGIPLLLFEDFHPDWNQVQAVLKQIMAWAATDSEGSCEITDALENIASDPALLKKVAGVWYQGLSLKTLPLSRSIDVELLTSVVGATLKPFLSAYSTLLLPEVDQESWRRKDCPLCGGKPDFSVLKEGGTRWLFCSRCDGEWLFSRIECPYCGTRNQETLAFLTSEDQADVYRIYVCEECRTYLKAFDSRGSGADVLLPLERVLTLHLDRQGQEKGYEPGWTTLKHCSGSSPGPTREEGKERRAS
jgi:formate dehydrogenase accessory protein FdhE